MSGFIPGRAAPVICRPTAGSTNTELQAMAMAGAGHGTVLYALSQTSGRGRMGRNFDSPVGGLYLSILWWPGAEPEDCLRLTPCAAVALCRCIEKICGLEPEIKWPNDLQIKGKKLCGILTEGGFDDEGRFFTVLGFGLNVNNTRFTPPLDGTASSLRLETGREFSIDALAAAIIPELDRMFESCFSEHESWLYEYRRRCNTVGAEIHMMVNGEKQAAKVLSVENDYALLLDVGGRLERKAFGEISVKKA